MCRYHDNYCRRNNVDVAASVGVASMAPVPDMDNVTHLDSESRAPGDHGKAVRPAHVRLASD